METLEMSRPYRLGQREKSVQRTRETILEATADLLHEVGLRGVTIDAVARNAGVSRVTVYDHFEHKAGLLEALAWWTFAQHDIDRVRRARLQDDVRAALFGFVQENARFFDTVGPRGRSILKTASSDPDAAAVLQTTYFDARRAAITELVDRLDTDHELAPEWLPERAVDALMIITSLEAFETLTDHGRLELEAAAAVLGHMAAALLRDE